MAKTRAERFTDGMVEEAAELFRALAEPSRLRLLRALLDANGEVSQGDLAEQTGLSQANASKHLGLLVRAGLVQREPSGTTMLYRPLKPFVAELCELACGHVARREQARSRRLR